MKDYYLLVGLNSKEVKLIDVTQRGSGLIEVVIENRKKKIKCPVCIRSVYLDSCGSSVDLIIYKKRYRYYTCNKIFTEELNITS